jgi:hypothetical protein
MSRLNSLIKSYSRQPQYWLRNIRLRLLRKQSDLKVVFVVGAPRSGTTLLHTLIAAHSNFYTVPYETALFTWQNLFDRERLGMTQQETIAALKQSKDVVDFLDTFVRSLDEYNEEAYFVEKTPQHVNHIKKLMKHFPNAKFIHIYRDVRDCFCSSKSVDSMVSFRDVRFFAKYWNQSVRNGLKYENDERVHTLSYEDLVTDPKQHLGVMMSFLGKSLEGGQTDPNVYGADRRADLKHFKKLSSPITPVSVGRWRNGLSEPQKEAFNSLSGELLEQLDYPQS